MIFFTNQHHNDNCRKDIRIHICLKDENQQSVKTQHTMVYSVNLSGSLSRTLASIHAS